MNMKNKYKKRKMKNEFDKWIWIMNMIIEYKNEYEKWIRKINLKNKYEKLIWNMNMINEYD